MEIIKIVFLVFGFFTFTVIGFYFSMLIYKTKAIREMIAERKEQITLCRSSIEIYKDDPDQVYAYESKIDCNELIIVHLEKKLNEIK